MELINWQMDLGNLQKVEKLTSGLEDLQVGVASLGQGLGNASDQLKSASTESKNAEIYLNPLNLSKTDNDQVPVNGIAMAPLYDINASLVVALSNKYDFAKYLVVSHPETQLGLVEISL